MKKENITVLVNALLICLFVYAAMSKLLSYSTFTAQLHTHPLLKPFAGLLAWTVPTTELLITAFLVIPQSRLLGLYSSAVLLIVFTVYLVLMLLTDKNLPCSCGGLVGALSWRGHVVFNVGFIVLAIRGIWLEKKLNRIRKLKRRS